MKALATSMFSIRSFDFFTSSAHLFPIVNIVNHKESISYSGMAPILWLIVDWRAATLHPVEF